MTPLALYPAAGQVTAYDPIMYNSGNNGAFTVSNMVRGLYRADIQAPPAHTSFSFFVETNGTGGPLVSVDSLQRATPAEVRTPQDYAYSAQASDARYLKAGAGGATFTGPVIAPSFVGNIPPGPTNDLNTALQAQLATKLAGVNGIASKLAINSGTITGMVCGSIIQMHATNWIPGLKINAVFAGDSITAGNYSSGVYSWPYFLTNMVPWSSAIAASHITAVGGSVLDGSYCSNGGNTVTNRLPTDMGYKSNDLNNVWFCFIGANDYIGPAGCGSVAPDPAYWCSLYDQILYRMKTNGWTTVVFTILPRSQGADGWDSAQTYSAPAVRDRMNQLIRWGLGNADFVVDIAAVMTDLRTNTAYGNVVISVDGIHPNNLGSGIIAQLADSALRLNHHLPRSTGYLGNALALGQAITNVSLVEGTLGCSITNFGGNQLALQSPSGGDSIIFYTPASNMKVMRNAGTYGGTGNTWFEQWSSGSSSIWTFGVYNGSWAQWLTISNTGSLYFEKGITIYRSSSAAPTIPSGTDGAVWNSNRVLYWVTAAKTNLISNGN